MGKMAIHCSLLAWEIPIDRGAWWATVHSITELDMTETIKHAHTCTEVSLNVWLTVSFILKWFRELGREAKEFFFQSWGKARRENLNQSAIDVGFTGDSVVKNLPVNAGDVGFLGQEDPLEEEMATHSSILAEKIPWTEELVGYSLWGHTSQMTEGLSMHTLLMYHTSTCCLNRH